VRFCGGVRSPGGCSFWGGDFFSPTLRVRPVGGRPMLGRQGHLPRRPGTAGSGERRRLCRGWGIALTPIALFDTFTVKSYETLVESDTRVDVNSGIGGTVPVTVSSKNGQFGLHR